MFRVFLPVFTLLSVCELFFLLLLNFFFCFPPYSPTGCRPSFLLLSGSPFSAVPLGRRAQPRPSSVRAARCPLAVHVGVLGHQESSILHRGGGQGRQKCLLKYFLLGWKEG